MRSGLTAILPFRRDYDPYHPAERGPGANAAAACTATCVCRGLQCSCSAGARDSLLESGRATSSELPAAEGPLPPAGLTNDLQCDLLGVAQLPPGLSIAPQPFQLDPTGVAAAATAAVCFQRTGLF